MARGDDALRGKIRRVAWEWLTGSHPPDPEPGDLPTAEPDLTAPPPGEARVTWIGHATALVRLPGLTLLTDPVFSRRCSPVPFWGPKRFVPPTPGLDALPDVDAVLLSHDHYDHLDRASVKAIHRRFGEGLTWVTPLGYRGWLGRLGIERVRELDWWEETTLAGGYRTVCLPARHWTRRTPWSTNIRLWAGWAVLPGEGAMEGGAAADRAMDSPLRAGQADPAIPLPTQSLRRPAPRVYFAGDTAYCPAFREIGERVGPFDVSLIPVGAYEPRWFMRASHVKPEEAVRIYREVGRRGAFVPVHWGTWRLTFEDPLEPPERLRAAWRDEGLDPDALRLLRHGETVTVRRGP